MKLTEEQKKLLLQNLKVRNVCPNCGSSSKPMILDDQYLLTSFEYSNQSYQVGGPMAMLPFAVCICPDCGNIMLFDLKTLKVI